VRRASALLALALVVAAGCGGGEGGRVQRVEPLQRCLTHDKKLPTHLTADARLPGSSSPAQLLDTELLSPSAARLYVFGSVDAAKSAAAGAEGSERRDNVVIVYDQPPSAEDRKALEDCFSGKF
jgi:hypothetical protein